MNTPAGYTLYGAEISYFTGKVRAYLRWKGLPFVEVASSADVYREVIVPRVGFPVIPVVVTPEDTTLQDSTEIIDALEQRHGEPSVIPASAVQRLVAALLELYGDEWLVIPAMHYRWHHNRDWALRAFGELSAPLATPEEQFALGSRRAAPFAQAAVLLGAAPHMHGAVERSYEDLLGELDRHFAVLPYLLGTRPSIGDFGLIGPLYAHQFRDPASGELMRRLAPNVVRWVERMQHPPMCDGPALRGGPSMCDGPALRGGPPEPRSGEFLPGDEIPERLLPVLQRMMRELMPVLADSARLLTTFLAAHPGDRVPRVIGQHAFDLEGQRGERIVRPYSLWMLQRARDCYRALAPAERERADNLLDRAGGRSFRDFVDPPRLARAGMSVALA